ncbi:carbohydrate binding domain-containing protein [uncultured Paenibacillus sp.]|uniref:carbohydrate binding domain-containing protein n=1 Tax=uncultured Paenibacillus sp. TaxID=227322 RepID=UPI0028D82B6D|nr:carbohydrate binding domain-containing protein [uncultured Paenibacillus sp.]
MKLKWKRKRLSILMLGVALTVPGVFPEPRETQAQALEVPNGGFEQSADSYPGWFTRPAMPSEGLGVSIRQGMAASGSNSLYMTDNSTTKSLEVAGEPIPVTPGKTYTVTANVYVEAKSVRVYLRFKRSGSTADLSGGTYNILANKVGAWDKITVEGAAPDGAEYAEITFYYGASGTGTGAFIDDVELKEKVDEQPFELLYDAPVEIGDAVSYALSQAAAYGIGPDGRWEQYVATVGSPVSFHVVDALTGELKFTERIAGSSDTIWSIAKGADGNMYFSSNGILYRYMVNNRSIEALGTNPSNKQVFDLKASADYKIYGSTYSNTNMGRVFEYDIATGAFRDLGVMKEGQQYARGLGVTDAYVYVGTGTTAHLMRYDRASGEIAEINIPGVTGTTKTISEVDVYGGKLFAYSGADLYVLDAATGAYVRTIEFQTKLSPPSPEEPNLVYYKLGGELYSYDIAADLVTRIDGIPKLPADTAVKAHAWIVPDSGPLAGRQVLAGMAAFGESFLFDPKTKLYTEHAIQVPTSATAVNALETDGRYLYLGGYQRGMSVYDLQTGKFVYSNKEFHQPEGIGFLGNAAYYGTYTGAVMYRLDMNKPLNYIQEGNGNPGMALNIEELQDRPFTMTAGDGKLFIGTFPTYGQLGGALTIAEEAVDEGGSVVLESETIRDIVPNQSLFGLAYKDGKIFGGTSVWGGLGVNPAANEAELFVYELETKSVTAGFTPRIPGVAGDVKLIGELSVGPDGLIWGILDGFVSQSAGYDAALFALDPQTLQIVKSKIITRSPFNTSKYRPYYIRWGNDGLMYSTIGRKLMAIDPDDLTSRQIIPGTVNLMTLAPDGSIYYAVGSKLYKIPVQLQSVSLQLGDAELKVGESTDAAVSILQKNGRQALLGGAEIAYASGNPDVVAVNGDTLTGMAAGTAAITATVRLDGRELVSAPVEIIVSELAPEVSGNVIRIPAGLQNRPLDTQLLTDVLSRYPDITIESERSIVLPLTVLDRDTDAVIRLQTPQASWTVAADSLQLKRWSAGADRDAGELYLKLDIAEESADPDSAWLVDRDVKLLSALHAFKLSLVDDVGTEVYVPGPGPVYHEPIITLRDEAEPEATVVMIDPQSGKAQKVPARIEGREASLRSADSGTFAVVQVNK